MAHDSLPAHLLFVDIETVTAQSGYEQLSPVMQRAWQRKAATLSNPDNLSADDLYFDRGGIYAEFGKIIVISVGFFHALEDGETELRVKCISGDNEQALLTNFKETLLKFDQKKLQLCAHNGKEFDFPYLCRRMLANGIALPDSLDLGGLRSWQVPHVDTMQLWKFGDYKSFTPLELLAAVFDLEVDDSDAIQGGDINRVYHREDDLEKITRFCRRNISLLAQVYLRLKSLPTIDPERITVV
ncbi:MAG: ribonuclease H-like domain-containing protein [Tunicatimonas sp.]